MCIYVNCVCKRFIVRTKFELRMYENVNNVDPHSIWLPCQFDGFRTDNNKSHIFIVAPAKTFGKPYGICLCVPKYSIIVGSELQLSCFDVLITGLYVGPSRLNHRIENSVKIEEKWGEPWKSHRALGFAQLPQNPNGRAHRQKNWFDYWNYVFLWSLAYYLRGV